MTFPDAALSDAFRRLIPRPVITPRPVRVVNFGLGIGARGAPLDGTEHSYPFRLGLGGPATILTWSLVAMASGLPVAANVTVDIVAGTPLSSGGSICGTHRPALVGQSEVDDQPPTGWAVTLSDPSTVVLVARTVDGIAEVVNLTLRLAIGIDPLGDIATTDTGAAFTDDTGAPYTMET